MENHEISVDGILKYHGGVHRKDFKDIINEDSNPDEIGLIYNSPNYS